MKNIERIGLKELRGNFDKYIKAVSTGKEFIVMKRSKAALRLSLPEEETATGIDLTAYYPDGISAQELLKKLRKIK